MNSCTCASQGKTLEFIECAPCPPPMLNNSQFREHALSRQVCLTEICSIARRCRPEDPEVGADCFPVSSTTVYTTRNETAASSIHTTDYSLYTTNRSASTTGYTTELFTDQPPSETVRDSTFIITIITVFAVSIVTVVAIVFVICVIRKRKRDEIKISGTAQKSENLKAIDEHPLHEAEAGKSQKNDVDVPSIDNGNSTYPASSLCNMKDETTGKTNPPDTNQLDGESVFESTRL